MREVLATPDLWLLLLGLTTPLWLGRSGMGDCAAFASPGGSCLPSWACGPFIRLLLCGGLWFGDVHMLFLCFPLGCSGDHFLLLSGRGRFHASEARDGPVRAVDYEITVGKPVPHKFFAILIGVVQRHGSKVVTLCIIDGVEERLADDVLRLWPK